MRKITAKKLRSMIPNLTRDAARERVRKYKAGLLDEKSLFAKARPRSLTYDIDRLSEDRKKTFNEISAIVNSCRDLHDKYFPPILFSEER